MSKDEKQQILKMLDQGTISAEDAVRLIEALDKDEAGEFGGSDFEREFESGDSGFANADDDLSPDPELAATAAKARSLWQIPLWIGTAVTLASAYPIYRALQANNYGFWFYCAWVPFLLGVVLIALAASSRTSRWLFVRIEQARGKKPQRIVFGIPLPLKIAGWFLRTFGDKIPELKGTNVDEMVEIFDASMTADAPLIVNVRDEDDGEQVQVFIG